MSGSSRGNPPQGAPGRTISSLLLAEPAIQPGGQLATWLAQFLVRLSAYVGPANGSGDSLTVQTTANSEALALTLGQGAGVMVAEPQIPGLEGIGAQGMLPRPPESGGASWMLGSLPPMPLDAPFLSPLTPLQPWLTDPDAAPYTFGMFVPGVMSNGQILFVTQIPVPMIFPANFGASVSGGSSLSSALANATASTIIAISQCLAADDPTNPANFASIGTITFSAAGHAGALATVSGTSKAFAGGDWLRLSIVTADATLANFTATLVADRV